MRFSYFTPPITNIKSYKQITLEDFYSLIKDNDLYKLISIREQSEEIQQKHKKYKLPFVTFSGVFSERKTNSLDTYTGLICIDIDKLNSIEDAEDIKQKLLKLKIKPALCFISPRGKGVKAIYGIIKSKEQHLEVFNLLDKYIKQELNIDIDKSGKDITRSCFLSYDPNAILNEKNLNHSLSFELDKSIKKQSKLSLAKQGTNTNDSENNSFPLTKEKAIANSLRAIDKSVDGEKHTKLLSASRFLGGYVGSGLIEYSEAEQVLREAINNKPNVADFNLAYNTIKAGLEVGRNNPIIQKDDDLSSNGNSISNSVVMGIFDELPKTLKEFLLNYKSDHEKDIAFLSVVTLVSSLCPKFYFKYGKKDKYFLNLFTYMIGKSGIGKGNANLTTTIVKNLSKQINQNLGYKYPTLAGDTSKASLIELINENHGNAFIFESETDTITSANKQEWGQFSDLLRKAFEHETYNVSRKDKNGKAKMITLSDPRMSIILTSTPNQLPFLIGNSTDGLAIRFLYYNIENDGEWKNQFNEKGLEEISSNLQKKIIKLVEYQRNIDYQKIEFTKEDQNRINNFFKDKFYNRKDDDLYRSIIVRMPVIFLRMISVIHLFEQMEGNEVKLQIPTELVEFGLQIMDKLIIHSDIVLNTLPKTSLLDTLTVSQRYIYNQLSNKFSLESLRNEGFNTRNRTFTKLIANRKLFNQLKRGTYLKNPIK